MRGYCAEVEKVLNIMGVKPDNSTSMGNADCCTLTFEDSLSLTVESELFKKIKEKSNLRFFVANEDEESAGKVYTLSADRDLYILTVLLMRTMGVFDVFPTLESCRLDEDELELTHDIIMKDTDSETISYPRKIDLATQIKFLFMCLRGSTDLIMFC